MRRGVVAVVVAGTVFGVGTLVRADTEDAPRVVQLSADALRAGTLAYGSFEDHVRQGISDTDALKEHLRNPKNYLVVIDDRDDHFTVAFVPVGHPALELRRGGGWQCVIERAGWRVLGCNVMK